MWLEILMLLVSLIFVWYLYLQYQWRYWKVRGVPEVLPKFPFGSTNEIIFRTKNFSDIYKEAYQKFKGQKYYGLFGFGSPSLDMDLIKNILIKDFDHFVDRRVLDINKTNKTDKFVKDMLIRLEGDHWKSVRAVITPMFTSGKLKYMNSFINIIGKSLTKYISEKVDSDSEFELKETFGRFAMDVIATCGFGVTSDSFVNTESSFLKMARRISTPKGRMLQIMLILIFPKLAKMLQIPSGDPVSVAFFVDVVKKTMESRKKNGIRRNDMLDLFMDAMESDDIKDNEEEQDYFEQAAKLNDAKKKKLSLEEVVANCIILFIAGFETTSSTLAFACYELAMNPDIQDKLMEEIDEILYEKDDIEYSDISKMKYLDCVIHETLRRHTIAPVLERKCVKDYKVPGSDLTIEKGMIVQINGVGIMTDEKYFPNPEVFNPNNFSEENKAARNPLAFLGFGHGPRNCVGMRLALLEMKIGIVCILREFRLIKCARTPEKIVLDRKSFQLYVADGLWLKAEKR